VQSELQVPFTGLLVLSEPEAAQALAAGLRQAGFQVMTAADLPHAQRIASQVMPDFVVCDLEAAPDAEAWVESLMRGEMSGPDGGRVLYGLGLVAAASPSPASAALDRVMKPMAAAALIARIADRLYVHSACTNGESHAQGHWLAAASARGPGGSSARADLASDLVRANHVPDLMLFAPTERKLFFALSQAAPRMLRREQIREAVWPGEAVSERVVDQYVKRLRVRLTQLGSALRVTTVRGHGYRLDLPERIVIKPSSSLPTVGSVATQEWP
jgi:DNA-binding response OmpR family regulator